MDEPAMRSRDAFTVVGLGYRGANEDGEISALWARVTDYTDEFAALATGDEWYGVCTEVDESSGTVSYVAGVAAGPDATVPAEMEAADVPANEYAVFPVTLADLESDLDAIYGEWLPEAAYRRADGPEFECYGSAFDGTPESEFEYFLPVVEG
ncbi:GyrI-like domain-containing protein [Halomarina salina]|uniref:GyrI-like domain-containing protein n=1 Tax=Halomarina salina TaxID=1872699 RepID=A0ABD5RNI3_9EURY|nr:effector binding domain-containing protein [Halomarina salina]